MVQPSGGWTFVLRLLLPGRYRDVVIDDLLEEWGRRARGGDRRRADAWLRREVLRSLFPALSLRLGGARRRASSRRPGLKGVAFRLERGAAEVRQGLRRLARAPGFAVAVVLTMGIGLGAATSIFALADGVLLRPLPFREPERLVVIRHWAPGLGLAEADLSDGLFEHYRAHARSFEEMALWQDAIVNLDGDGEGEPERVDLALVTPSFLPLLGVAPALGAGFGPDDVGGRAVLLSDGLWRRRYGGDPDVVGRTIEVNGRPRRVAGVMPAGFRFPTPGTQLWMDLGFAPGEARIGSLYYQGAGRLGPGVTAERAAAELAALVPGAVGEYPDASESLLEAGALEPFLEPLHEHLVGGVRPTVSLLLGAVLLVLLAAGANVASLSLVRAGAREREASVRAALGARGADALGPFVAEGVLLTAAGAALGLLGAALLVRGLVASAPFHVPRLDEVAVDGRASAFGLGLAGVLGLVCVWVPSARALRRSLSRAVGSAGRASTTDRKRRHARRGLVVAQVALALTLVVGSALLVRSHVALRAVDRGFEPRSVLTFEVVQPFRGYETWERSAGFQLALLEALAALPGVVSAGAISGLPMTGSDDANFPYALEVRGRPVSDVEGERRVRVRLVTPGWFDTAGTPLVEGRAPAAGDRAEGRPVLVSANLAARLAGAEPALGLQVRRASRRSDRGDAGWMTVVGVVADVRDDGAALPAPEILYLPVLDAPVDEGFRPGYLTFALRTSVPPLSLAPVARAAVHALDPRMPVAKVRTLEHVVAADAAPTTFTMLLLLSAGGASLLLGAVGLSGVLSCVVGERRREIGLRVALGAGTGEVLRLVVGEGLALTAAGAAVGLAGSLWLSRLLEGLVFGVSRTDFTSLAASSALLLIVALGACFLPARRALRVRPAEVLAEG